MDTVVAFECNVCAAPSLSSAREEDPGAAWDDTAVVFSADAVSVCENVRAPSDAGRRKSPDDSRLEFVTQGELHYAGVG